MSYNARLPSSGHHRGRPHGNRPRFAPGVAAKAEDAQPNELLNRRNAATGPPVIRASVPIPRNFGRGRGRGGSELGRNAQANAPTHTIPTSRPPNSFFQLRHVSDDSRGAKPDPTLQYRTERSNYEKPSATENGTYAPAYGSLSAALNQKHALDAASASNPPPDFSKRKGHDRPAVPPRPLPPLPRRQTLFPNLRDPPPHLGDFGHASIPDLEARYSAQVDSAAGRSAMLNSAGSSRASSSDEAPLSSRVSSRPANSTKSLASASDILLSDLSKPSTLTETSRSHMSPPSKRRKVSSPGIPGTHASSSPRPPPRAKSLVAIAPHAPTQAVSRSPGVPPPSEAPTSATPSSNVKRERSPSPTIGTTSAPQLITEGCVRIAPMPPECKSTRRGHKEARKIWTTREVTRLRDLGVQPTRIFVREDGMVIDWKSKVPVMSDTLRPPPAAASPTKAAPLPGRPRSPPTKKQKLQSNPIGETGSREHELDSSARESGPTSTRRPLQSTSREEVPAPGETIWRRVFPPPRLSVADFGENVPHGAEPYARSGCPSPAVGPSTGGQAATDIVDLTEGDNAEVEIIDLTDESNIPPEDLSSPHTAAHTELPAGLSADANKMEAAALRFLQRYVADFASDRAALASAYSRAATFSTQTLPSPQSHPDAAAPSTPLARHHGRFEIIAALLDLPDDEAPSTAAPRKVDWDFVYAREAGDVLLVCYTAAPVPVPEQMTARGKGKQKEKAIAELLGGLCEQRFILRPREWDKEDRSTPGVWPLVAVAHQMLFRPLPS